MTPLRFPIDKLGLHVIVTCGIDGLPLKHTFAGYQTVHQAYNFSLQIMTLLEFALKDTEPATRITGSACTRQTRNQLLAPPAVLLADQVTWPFQSSPSSYTKPTTWRLDPPRAEGTVSPW